jgi:rRNA processing protein Gar1
VGTIAPRVRLVRLGPIRSTPGGLLVLRVGDFDLRGFRRGLAVLTGDGRRVGTTYDVIGGVRSPYVVVRLDPGVEVRRDEELYVALRPSSPSRGRRRR